MITLATVKAHLAAFIAQIEGFPSTEYHKGLNEFIAFLERHAVVLPPLEGAIPPDPVAPVVVPAVLTSPTDSLGAPAEDVPAATS